MKKKKKKKTITQAVHMHGIFSFKILFTQIFYLDSLLNISYFLKKKIVLSYQQNLKNNIMSKNIYITVF